MTRKIFLSRLALLTSIAACTSQPSAPPTTEIAPSKPASPSPSETKEAQPSSLPASSESDMQTLARSHNALGIDVWKSAVAGGNQVLSPASIAIALNMTYLGARGQTAAEMAKAMHLVLAPAALESAHATLLTGWLASANETLELGIANRLFVDKSLAVEAPFLLATKNGFSAPAELLDFAQAAQASRTHINAWIAKTTHDRIVDLIPPDGVNSDTRLVLTNAIFFKAQWMNTFTKALTKKKAFYAGGTRKIDVLTMQQVENLAYRDAGDVEVLSLSYSTGPFELNVILPKKRNGLSAVESTLSIETLERWVGGQVSHERVRFEIPKFKVEPPADPLRLKDALVSLGMIEAFDRHKADFTAIHQFKKPADRLLISEVFHKAFVAIDEDGTEAAAATAVVMARAGGGPPTGEPKPFIVDHPFLFLLRDRTTGMVLFLGRVTDPS